MGEAIFFVLIGCTSSHNATCELCQLYTASFARSGHLCDLCQTWLVGDITDKRRDGHRVAVGLLCQPHHHRLVLRYEPGAWSSQRVTTSCPLTNVS